MPLSCIFYNYFFEPISNISTIVDAEDGAAVRGAMDEDAAESEDAEEILDPTTIDAHWLQRQVAKHVTDDADDAQRVCGS